MGRRIFWILLLILFVVIILSTFIGPQAPGGPNLICNGSFESGNFVDTPEERIEPGPKCKKLCGGSSSLDNWQIARLPETRVQTCAAASDAVCWWNNANQDGITARDGQFAVDLTGFERRPPNEYGRVQQSVPTQPGGLYEFSFYLGSSIKFPPPMPAPPKAPRMGVVVEVFRVREGEQGKWSVNATIPTAKDDKSHWDSHGEPPDSEKFRFHAVDQTTTLRFTGTAEPGMPGDLEGRYLGLDNVSLRKVCWIVDALLFDCFVQDPCRR
jgi:hypothetical protein